MRSGSWLSVLVVLLAFAQLSGVGPAAAPPAAAPDPSARSTAGRLQDPMLTRLDVDLGDAVSRRIASPWIADVRRLFAARLDFDALPDEAEMTLWLVGVEGERPRIDAISVRGTERGDLFAARELLGTRVSFFDEEGASLEGPMLARPVEYRRIASRLGPRENPFGKRRPPRFHAGTDYAAPVGTPIRSVADGVVKATGYSWRAGRYVIVAHEDGLEARYLHMHRREPGLKKGKRVRKGEPLGTVGRSGKVTGAHLHFELRQDGRPLDSASLAYPSERVLDEGRLHHHRARLALLLTVRDDGRFDLTDPNAAWLFAQPPVVEGASPVPLRRGALAPPPALPASEGPRFVEVRPPLRRRRARRRLRRQRSFDLDLRLAEGGCFVTI